MKRFYTIILLLSIVGLTYAGPKYDAVYHLISKSYTLNEDGSMDYHFRKEVQLFTSNAFDDYGETFIPYNTELQTLIINEAYTIRKDGSIVQTPKNAFNPSLPKGCTDCERFNTIREMVVTHTALEYDATIVLDYTIHTQQPFMPVLMESVNLYETAPIDKYEVSLSVPRHTSSLSMNINYHGENVTETTGFSSDSTQKTYHWTFTDLERDRELLYMAPDEMPYMLLMTNGGASFVNNLVKQNAFSSLQLSECKEVLADLCKDTMSMMEKAVAIRDYVAANVHTNDAPMKLMNYIVASPLAVWKTNCGNVFEKDLLFYSMLREADVPCSLGVTSSSLTSDPKSMVKIQSEDKTYYLSVGYRGNLSMQSGAVQDDFCAITGEVVEMSPLSIRTKVDADIQINRVSGKMIPDVTIKEDSIDSPKTNTLLKSEKKLADTDVSSMPGNYYSVFVNDGKYGCEFHGSLLDRYRTHPVFVPITDESYHYTVMLPQNNHWINKDFSYEKSYDFGSVKINYTFQQDKVEITRELKLNTNVIDLKQYKKFRAMMIEWELERPMIFERQRN